jgi:hypothetical protein
VNLPGMAAEFRVIENNDPIEGLSYSLERESRCHEKTLVQATFA